MKVVVRVARFTKSVQGMWWFAATCETGECHWTYTNAVRSDVEDHARWHRQEHRRAATVGLKVDDE